MSFVFRRFEGEFGYLGPIGVAAGVHAGRLGSTPVLETPVETVARCGRARYPLGVQAFQLPPVPLREDEHGVIRVARSRVTLDSLVALFDRGATAEEIAQSFPTLALGDVYEVLSYVVVRRTEVDAYLQRRETEESATRDEAERRSPSADLRARLTARREGRHG
jgi:uncharacterized protein (DUF433 family)